MGHRPYYFPPISWGMGAFVLIYPGSGWPVEVSSNKEGPQPRAQVSEYPRGSAQVPGPGALVVCPKAPMEQV